MFMMLRTVFCSFVCFCVLSVSVFGDNPEIEIVSPSEGGVYNGAFVVDVRNFDYVPELATNPVEDFAIGVDADGGPILYGVGHLHGWVFEVDEDGRKVRNDAGVPTPGSYLRFYGAGGAEYLGDFQQAVYIKEDVLPPGRYKAFFQLQANDHTGALQASAPAFPGIASVNFTVQDVKENKGKGKGKEMREKNAPPFQVQ